MVCFMGSKHTEVSSAGVAAFIDFVAQDNLAQFESAGASALHVLRFNLNPGDATEMQGIGV